MGKWKQGIALFLSVILSITSVFTWNSTIRVHAEEAVIKSSAEGFEMVTYDPEEGLTTQITKAVKPYLKNLI